MSYLIAKSSKGQLKIQQMAFVLVAVIIFFVLVGLLFVRIQLSSLRSSSDSLGEREAIEKVKKITSLPEFAWNIEDCASCIDLDKVFALKSNTNYRDFWETPLLKIEKVYPIGEKKECTSQNYPDCTDITLVEKEDFIGKSVYAALCRYEGGENYYKCELGRIIVGFEVR